MDKLAQQSKGGVYTLPHSHVEGAPLDMSFSGLKTAVVNLAHHAEQVGEPLDAPALARDFAQAVSDTLVPRVMEAAKQSGRTAIVAAGGVAANSVIRADLERACKKAGCRLYLPPLRWCGDNGAMIGAPGVLRISGGPYGGHGPERLCHPRHQRINDTGGHRTAGIFCRYLDKRRGSAAALIHYLREDQRRKRKREEKSILKQRSGEIAVAGIRQKNGNGLAFKFRPFGQLHGSPHSGAGGDAHQHTLPLANQLAGGEGVLIFHGDDLVIHLGVQYVGDKACTDALDLVSAAVALAEDGRALRLHGHHLHSGIFALEKLTHTGQGAAGAYAGYERIHLTVPYPPRSPGRWSQNGPWGWRDLRTDRE